MAEYNKYLLTEKQMYQVDLDKALKVIRSVKTEKQMVMAMRMADQWKKKYRGLNRRYEEWLDTQIEQQRFNVLNTDSSLGGRG